MQMRSLGIHGPQVSALGFGAMVLSPGMYGEVQEDQSIRTLHQAMAEGVNFFDTADAYGNGHNEQLLGRALKGRRNEVILATKFGIVFDPSQPSTPFQTNWSVSLPINGRPEYVHAAIDNSLARLGVDHVDLWYLHFPDPSVPIEETIGAMADVVQAGKVRYLGLSNITAEQLRRAHQVHPITAVQYEYSLMNRHAEQEILPTVRELSVGFVPWAPLGSGFLSGAVKQIASDDFRNNNPRFHTENLQTNHDRFAPLVGMANELGITPAQLALAWLLHQDEAIVPIPGTRTDKHLAENVASAKIRLLPEQLDYLQKVAPANLAVGNSLL